MHGSAHKVVVMSVNMIYLLYFSVRNSEFRSTRGLDAKRTRKHT